ncbi:hypothetical protein [Mesorhizobium sp. A556]
MSRRVSIHSPPSSMFAWCRCAQSAISVMPGSRAMSMRRMPSSQTWTASHIATTSSTVLMTLAMFTGSWPSMTRTPRASSARRPAGRAGRPVLQGS